MSTPRFRWLVRQEMQFDKCGEAIGHAEVKVLQYETQHVEYSTQDGITVFQWAWYDIPTVHDE